MAGVLEQLIEKPVRDGLAPYDQNDGFSGNSDMKLPFIASFGLLFTIESAYQVMYTVSQKITTSLGTSESGAKAFNASSSMALTQGKASAGKFLTSA
jgi:hypothetical protein